MTGGGKHAADRGMGVPFQIAVHDGEEDLEEQVDRVDQHGQQEEPCFAGHHDVFGILGRVRRTGSVADVETIRGKRFAETWMGVLKGSSGCGWRSSGGRGRVSRVGEGARQLESSSDGYVVRGDGRLKMYGRRRATWRGAGVWEERREAERRCEAGNSPAILFVVW